MEKENYNIQKHFAACVILYHPKKGDIANLSTYIDKVTKLYVYDNTESHSNEDLFKDIENIYYFWDGENKGLSVRLNEACQRALEDNFEYLLTMDQDSYFPNDNLERYFNNILNFNPKDEVAVYGLEYSKEDINPLTPYFSVVEHLITSGSVINLNLFDKIGGFDENLFIDAVDIDYCYAALVKGYKNIKFGQLYFHHTLGNSVKKGSIYTLYLFKRNISLHTPVRIYYMYRNMLYVKRKYEKIIPEIIHKFVKNQKHHISKNIKYSDNLIKTLKYKKKAISDYNHNKMGKISE